MVREDEEVENEVRGIMERNRANTGRLDITARNVAKDIINANAEYYSDALLQLIPKEILGTELANDNLYEIGRKIDEIRFRKEKELSALFQGITDGKEKQKLEEIINGDGKGLNKRQLNKIRQIKFLNNLAQAIIHQ